MNEKIQAETATSGTITFVQQDVPADIAALMIKDCDPRLHEFYQAAPTYLFSTRTELSEPADQSVWLVHNTPGDTVTDPAMRFDIYQWASHDREALIAQILMLEELPAYTLFLRHPTPDALPFPSDAPKPAALEADAVTADLKNLRQVLIERRASEVAHGLSDTLRGESAGFRLHVYAHRWAACSTACGR